MGGRYAEEDVHRPDVFSVDPIRGCPRAVYTRVHAARPQPPGHMLFSQRSVRGGASLTSPRL